MDPEKNYHNPVIQNLEDTLIEIFDKYGIHESPKGVYGEYSWWNDMDAYITVGNIPDDRQATLILTDLFQIKEKVEKRLNLRVSIRKGDNGNSGACWISIKPLVKGDIIYSGGLKRKWIRPSN